MKIRSLPLAIIVLVVFFGGIALSATFNLWKTESTKTPAKIQKGEFSGENDPSDIRGSYSFADIEKAFNIPVAVLAKAFGVPYIEDPAGFKAKNLEELYGELAAEDKEIGTDAVRLFAALYTGLPHTPEEAETHEESAQSEDRTIKGKTTFNDLLEWGLSKEDIEAALGIKMGARALTVRDFCKEKEIEFSSVKTELQSKVDALE